MNEAGCVVERDATGRVVTSRMVMRSGRLVDPLDLQADDVSISDIAHHLSMICRFGGAVREHYSVAEHSVLVCRDVEHRAYKKGCDVAEFRYLLLLALLHDASEAYLGDVIRPRKVRHPELADEEHAVGCRIERLLGLTAPVPAEWRMLIKQADNAVCRAEAETLIEGGGKTWNWGSTVASQYRPLPLAAGPAMGGFLAAYGRLYPSAMDYTKRFTHP